MDRTYPVRQQRIPNSNRRSGGIRYTVPSIRFLGYCTLDVMITEEWSERRKLHPSIAQLLIGIPI
jgi:hypothetical protein